MATVGGPTYLSQIAYKASDNSVYYLESDMGGKGCPSIIHSISLATNKDVEVKTCDEVFQQFFSGESGEQKYSQFITDTYQSLPYLGSVSLKNNNIAVRVEVLSERIENGEKYWTEFRATLTQDNKEVAKLDFRGCAEDQPHIFEGYGIPNTDAMAILISNKGDCFEGGYVKENLSVVKGIKYYDTNIIRSVKGNGATEPNTGNMVVYATASPTSSTPQKNLDTKIILMAALLLVGGVLGYIVGRKSPHSPNPANPSNL